MMPLELQAFTRLPAMIAQWAAPLYCVQFQTVGVDPLLVAAVMDRESAGGDALRPKGASGTGDKGHGLGLMQLDDRHWPGLMSATWPEPGAKLWQDANVNIYLGARYLLNRIQRARKYWMEEMDAISVGVASYNADFARVREAADQYGGEALIQAVDKVTTGGDYVTDVFRRWVGFQGLATSASA